MLLTRFRDFLNSAGINKNIMWPFFSLPVKVHNASQSFQNKWSINLNEEVFARSIYFITEHTLLLFIERAVIPFDYTSKQWNVSKQIYCAYYVFVHYWQIWNNYPLHSFTCMLRFVTPYPHNMTQTNSYYYCNCFLKIKMSSMNNKPEEICMVSAKY